MNKQEQTVLNGPTCAGKITIAHLAQDRLPVPHVHMELDTFVATRA